MSDELIKANARHIDSLGQKIDKYNSTLHEKVNGIAVRVGKIEERVQKNGERLDRHMDAEEAAVSNLSDRVYSMSKDMSYMRGRVEEREKWQEKAGIVRMLITVLRFFGIRTGE